jgi:hypothetical protein
VITENRERRLAPSCAVGNRLDRPGFFVETMLMATIQLKPEEALVLIEFLLRFRDKEQLSIAHEAEANVLWDLCALLESQVPELVHSAYTNKLERARNAVASADWE